MRFYTNVHQRFNEILVRGYENGKHFTSREQFNPTLYMEMTDIFVSIFLKDIPKKKLSLILLKLN